MNCIRKGDAIVFSRPPSLPSFAAVAGKREGEGPLGSCFDEVLHDNALGQKCWEKAESLLQQRAASLALKKAGLDQTELDAVLCGDLQNQCTASGYALRELDMPSIGLYGACSTMVQALALAGCLVAGGAARRALAVTSSHFCAAERQFRTPLDYGGKRAPTAQWTVTGAGAVVVQPDGPGPFLRAAAFGRVRDAGVKDLANMGAAMAPAAAETLLRFFADTGAAPDDFDGIYTGDLGLVGSRLLHTLLEKEGVRMTNHHDCGLLIFDRARQPVQAGGSGCGCCASVLTGRLLPALRTGEMRRILVAATGALMSSTTVQQGESIPAVSHLVELAAEPKEEL